MKGRTGGLFLLVLVVSAGSAFGQAGAGGITAGTPVQVEMQKELAAPAPPAWGTATETALTIGAHRILPPSDAVSWNSFIFGSGEGGIAIYQTSATPIDWFYQVNIPSGAIVTKVVIEGCDSSATGQLVFSVAKGTAPTGPLSFLASGSTDIGATPGCGFFTLPVPGGGTQMINSTQNLWLHFYWQGDYTGLVLLHTIRVFYKLQVSPAPVSATFADVPVGSPLHRFIEALAASGITGGCGGGNYCPDAPLTRGQMAVFLAVALGLHFPN